MSIKYSFQKYDEQKMACAIGRNLSISTKQAIEISSFLKGKTVDRAQRILSEASELKKAIPFTRFTEGAGHKPGMASGKYPVNAALAILDLLKTAKANAETKGLGSPLKIVHILANAGGNTPRYGRQRGRSAKRTHVELILAESTLESEKPNKKKAPKAKETKTNKVDAKTEKVEVKPEVKETKTEAKKADLETKEKKVEDEPAKKAEAKKE